MSEPWRTQDVWIQLLGAIVGVVVGWAIGDLVGNGWVGVFSIGGFFAGSAVVKALQPSNTVTKDISWVSLLGTASVVLAALYLFANPQVLGGWTIVVVFAAFFVYGLVSLIVSARRANDDGAGDDGAD